MTKKVVLITGVSSGFGKKTAEFLSLKDNYIIYGLARHNPDLPNINFLTLDLTQQLPIKQIVDEIFLKEGRIDVLINNAGMGVGGALEKTPLEFARKQLEVNFFGTITLIQQVLPKMRKQNSGIIINVSSIGGIVALPYQGLYSAAKFALEAYTKALRLEIRHSDVKVILVNPGDFKTGFTASRIFEEESSKDVFYKDSFIRVKGVFEQDEQNGSDPIIFARTIERIIRTKNPKFRYLIGRLDQKLSVFISKILPEKWFEWILALYYKV